MVLDGRMANREQIGEQRCAAGKALKNAKANSRVNWRE
jgi:hypothetical protein